MGINSQREVHPALGRPFVGCSRKGYLVVDVAVHCGALWHRGVVINNDLGLLVDLLYPADELQGFSRVSFGIAGVTDYE